MHVASQETQVRQAGTSPPRPPHVEVILNAAAGADGGDDLREMVADAFAACGVEVRVFAARDGREAFELARRAVEGGARVVVAGGGDGTVNAVASLLVGTDCALGVLPLGTLNHFAKDLGIPLDRWGAASGRPSSGRRSPSCAATPSCASGLRPTAGRSSARRPSSSSATTSTRSRAG